MGPEQIDQFVPHVYRFAVYTLRDHHTALDVTQETMLRAWQRQREFRDLDNPRAWLLRVAANLCRDYARSQRSAVRSAKSLQAEPTSNCPEPWFGMIQDEQCKHLDNVIQSLSDRERTVLYLRAFEDLSHGQIADVLELKVGAVKVALSRARKSVRAAMQKQKEEERR